MSIIIEADEHGILHIPPDVLSAPGRRFWLHVEGNSYNLTPVDEQQPYYREMSTDEWIAGFRQWVASAPTHNGPPIPDEALRRENLYD